ncbi:MAG: hypothetical protein MI924_20335 [Chloroflexales bacterium]|nr:hypothetical protein [Chloroflexales bacterium]
MPQDGPGPAHYLARRRHQRVHLRLAPRHQPGVKGAGGVLAATPPNAPRKRNRRTWASPIRAIVRGPRPLAPLSCPVGANPTQVVSPLASPGPPVTVYQRYRITTSHRLFRRPMPGAVCTRRPAGAMAGCCGWRVVLAAASARSAAASAPIIV